MNPFHPTFGSDPSVGVLPSRAGGSAGFGDKGRAWILGLALFLACSAGLLNAHQSSDGYLTLSATSQVVRVRLDLPLRALDSALGLDADHDGQVTWGEVRMAEVDLTDYVGTNVIIRCGEKVQRMVLEPLMVDDHEGGAHVVLQWTFDGPTAGSPLEITYRCLFEVDPLHRGFVKWEHEGLVETAMLSPEKPTQQWSWNGSAHGSHSGWWTFVREGVVHIWTGYDHVLFLLALLFPAVLRWSEEESRWVALDQLRPALVRILKTVTAFTLAHSLTLTAAALNWIHLPSKWVESVIAASVILAAMNNLKPWFQDRGWMVAFFFGLIHGFGFAGVLAELDLGAGALVRTLVGFNLGVELGQAAIVAVFVPLAFMFRRTKIYRKGILVAGSAAIVLMASVWLVERLRT